MRKEQIITTTNNNQMEEKGMKQRFIHFKRKFVPALSGAIMGVMLMSTTCFTDCITPISTKRLRSRRKGRQNLLIRIAMYQPFGLSSGWLLFTFFKDTERRWEH